MTAHDHTVFVEGCYRCDLSRDEAYIPPHPCDSGDMDRVLCGCGAMHFYCSVCGELQDKCPLDEEDA